MIAGGGTGGHLFSGLAVAEAWIQQGGQAHFVGTEYGIEKSLIPQYGHPLSFIKVSSLKGGSLKRRLMTVLGLPSALLESYSLLKREKPDVVLGIGGYASGPIVLVAWLIRIPTAIVDQNALPGLTNRILGRFVRKIFVSFDIAKKFFNEKKVVCSGNPVMSSRKPQGHAYSPYGKCLLICGGSQGAHAINKGIVDYVKENRAFFEGVEIIHQTGLHDFAMVSKAYEELDLKVQVEPFFKNLEELYQKATIIVARSGAGTVTEIALWGLPSILIPYPFAADNHQWINAEALGEGTIILAQKEMTAKSLGDEILKLMESPQRLMEMSGKARSVAKDQAASDITQSLMAMAG